MGDLRPPISGSARARGGGRMGATTTNLAAAPTAPLSTHGASATGMGPVAGDQR